MTQGAPPPFPPPAPSSPATGASKEPLDPRLRRAIELVYAIEGVVAVRVWEWPGTVALGISTAPPGSEDLLRRAESATASLREPGERWELGFLEPEQAHDAKPDADPAP